MYADDLVLMVKKNEIEELLKSLFDISKEFDLKINPTKSAILMVKNHEKLEDDSLFDIPVAEEYRYLGILMNGMGSINPHMEKI